ncbi:beta-ketoacyl synthase N-terminal-like domain-containing protein [Actinomadura opuntiae]|uniref:beta-ketoacyl synthase N-terminal-like domain-containing protein n=1 Tax=Actinomadura sp. OS1-43 TaxID=604315 RepID=UPI00255AB083|nr:beta-ketoacyl synthase N-terminal-like domain-containing protein [Actinomadura sp. OS1-43]MDL4820278.1 beta-ketoacyl synthase N-terminal-like domain-containing protein [Actinomadura sp. OS1-43]
MPALITASAVRTCFGTGAETFAALLAGRSGAGPLRHGEPGLLGVKTGYHLVDGGGSAFKASRLLADAVGEAVRQAGLDPARERVAVLVGTGLGELSAVERWAIDGTPVPPRALDFEGAVRAVLPGAAEVTTLSGACSAGGHVLALAQDLVELGEADAVVAAAADTMTRSMLTMIGRVAPVPAAMVRPFDARREGVLLGEGAAAAVVVPATRPGAWPLARLAATGLSCDAGHPTAPDVAGIRRAMQDAYDRAGRRPADTGLVIAHGTGTALNDPAECRALRELGGEPLVTAVKGAVGHTSGAAVLVNLDVAIRCLHEGLVPPVAGLRTVLDEGAGLRFVVDRPAALPPGPIQLNAFGFGGVNAVTLLEAA